MTDLSKSQLNTILSALDGQARNPNSRDAALRAIARHAERLGLDLDDLLAVAAGLLDGRMNADDFRAQLRDESAGDSLQGDDPAGDSLQGQDDPAGSDTAEADAGAPQAAETAAEAAVIATGGDADLHAVDRPLAAANAQPLPTGESRQTARQQLLAACHAAEHWLQAERERAGEATPDDILRVLREAIGRAEGQPRERREHGQPRQGSKESQVITMLRRPEGATLAQIGETTGWQTHTIRGFFAGALKKRRGLQVTSQKQPKGVRTYHVAG